MVVQEISEIEGDIFSWVNCMVGTDLRQAFEYEVCLLRSEREADTLHHRKLGFKGTSGGHI